MTLYDGQSGQWSFGSEPSSCHAAPPGYVDECNWNYASFDQGWDLVCQ